MEDQGLNPGDIGQYFVDSHTTLQTDACYTYQRFQKNPPAISAETLFSTLRPSKGLWRHVFVVDLHRLGQ